MQIMISVLTFSISKLGIVSKFGHTPKNGTWAITVFAMTRIINIRNILFSEKIYKLFKFQLVVYKFMTLLETKILKEG